MHIGTSAQVKQLDNIAVNEFNISEERLMENAAQALSTSILRDFKDNDLFAVFCGKGKNGGDGILVATNIVKQGKKAHIYFVNDLSELNPLTMTALEKAKSVGVTCYGYTESVEKEAIIIDAILGIGINGDAKDNAKLAIDKINELKNKVLSIDIPSGLNADTGRVSGSVVRAKKTYTLAIDKVGLNVYPGAEYVGEKELIDIGIPIEALQKLNFMHHLIDSEMVAACIPKRNPNSHKGDFGKVGIVGGSSGMSGSVVMAAKAVLRSGAGMCYVFVPDDILPFVVNKLDEAIVLRESELEKYLDKLDAIAIGMGHAQNPKAKHIIKMVMQKYSKTVVIDADAINILSTQKQLFEKRVCSTVLTPHAVEFSRFISMNLDEINRNRMYLTSKFAKELNTTIVLKGAKTVVSSNNGEIKINPSGNSGMATAGSGDVLSGIISSLIAQGASAFDGASIGAYLHGLSGDLAIEDKTEYGLIAGDLIDYLPLAIKKSI